MVERAIVAGAHVRVTLMCVAMLLGDGVADVDREQLERARVANGRIRIGDLTFRQLYLDVEYLDRNALAVALASAAGMVATYRPSRSTVTRSQWSKISAMRCEI